MDPLITIHVPGSGRAFQPHERISCDVQLDAIDPAEIAAVETSVLWYTEGKGDEDLSVHFFERRVPSDCDDGDLRPLRRIECELPATPLSYHGRLFKIRWCVRVRVFLKGGRDVSADEIIRLGDIPEIPAAAVDVAPDDKKPVEAAAH